MRPLVLTLLVLSLATGCHARFKREAPGLGSVHAKAMTTGQPDVRLGSLNDDSIVGAVVNTVQLVNEASIERRIARAVDPNQMGEALLGGIAEMLEDGPPFAYTTEKSTPLLQLEIVRYGLTAAFLGAQGEFDYVVRTRIFRTDGRLVYKARTRCETAAGNPDEVATALGTVSNVRQIEEMTDAQIQEAYDTVARWCGFEVVRRMRKHAG